VHQRIPPIVFQLRQQKTLHGSAAWRSTAKEARWKHLCVIDHKEIAGAQELGKARNGGVLRAACVFVQHEQPAGAAFGRRRLRNQVRGQIEIEISNFHLKIDSRWNYRRVKAILHGNSAHAVHGER
jgi:hypothetical protein